MHRHRFGKWSQEYRDFNEVYEAETHNFDKKYTIIFNVRTCETCDFVQEKKADS